MYNSVDFTGVLETPKEMSEFKKFHIHISGYYYWGDGYRTGKDRRDFLMLMNRLEGDIDEILVEKYVWRKDFTFTHPDEYSGNCQELIPTNKYNPMRVYFHPMDFSGVLQYEDIERLRDYVMSTSRAIGREDIVAQIGYIEDTYHINDVDYINMIYQNSDKIIERVQEYVKKLSPKQKETFFTTDYRINDIAFDFARTGRIKRDFDENGGGISSDDADVSAVKTIIKQAIANGTIK